LKNNVRVERRTLADGSVKEYRYGPRAEPAAPTIASAIAVWQRSIEWTGLRAKTQENYVIYLRPFFTAFKQVPIADLKRGQILAMRDDIANERGHGAAHNFCRTVSAFFSWALDREYIEASPATRLTKKLLQGSLPPWRDDQAQRAMLQLPEPYRRAIVLAYHTGQRRGDLCALQWSDYDGHVIRLTQEKTDEPLQIPVHHMPAFKAELDAWKADRQAITILEFLGKPWRPAFLSKRLPDHLEQIGLPRRLGLHGLRYLAAVRLAEAGCSTHEIASITGHRTLAMVQKYTRGVTQKGLAEVAVLRLYKRTKNQQKSQ